MSEGHNGAHYHTCASDQHTEPHCKTCGTGEHMLPDFPWEDIERSPDKSVMVRALHAMWRTVPADKRPAARNVLVKALYAIRDARV